MIIKHIVELETVINDESPDPTAKTVLSMPEDLRNEFFRVAGTEMIEELLVRANEGNTWAELRVAK